MENEVDGDIFGRLEQQWGHVVLLIVDEISFIGKAFSARMHVRLQQADRKYFSETGLGPQDFTFGGISIILVGDFGQLEPIDDWGLCDSESSQRPCTAKMRHLWKHHRQGELLLKTFTEVFMLSRIHRSKDDLWWTESCLHLRDFTCTEQGDWDIW